MAISESEPATAIAPPGGICSAYSSPAAPGFSARTCASASSRRAPRCSASTTSSPAAARNIDAPAATTRVRADAPRRDASRSTSRSTRSTTWPARPRRSTTSSTRCRRRRPACMARSTCWAWPSASRRRSCRPRPPRSTATRRCTRSPRTTGATSTRSASAACYDEGKRCAETLFFDYWRQHRLRIKVVRIFNTYGPRMHPNDGRVVSQLHRPGAARARTSRSTATASRRAASATSTT